MAKIVLSTVTDTDMLTTINQNFTDLVDELQDKVLYRDNPAEETNTVVNDLDLDGNDIFNAGRIDTTSLFVDGVDVHALVDSGASEAAIAAAASAAAALVSQNAAAASATLAGTKAGDAAASATAAATSATNAAISAASAASDGATAGAAAATSAVSAFVTSLAAPTGAASIGSKYPGTGAINTTVEKRLDYYVNVKDFGAKGDGVTDDTNAFNAALTAAICVNVPAGTYITSGPIQMNKIGHALIGEGYQTTKILNSSMTTDIIVLLNGISNYHVKGLTLQKTAPASAGGNGIHIPGTTDATVLEELYIRYCYNGLIIGTCDTGRVENVQCVENSNNGILHINDAGYGAAQWKFNQILCGNNGSDGINVQAVAGPAGLILGTWSNVETFGNHGYGIAFRGIPGTGVFDVRINNCFCGQDNAGEILLDTYGGKSRIMNTFIELAGTAANGIGNLQPASGIGDGITITANNSDTLVFGCIIDNNSYNGINHAGGILNVGSCNIYNNGAAAVGGQRVGVVTTGGRLIASGNLSGNIGSVFQVYGFYATHQNVTIVGNDAQNNTVAGVTLATGSGAHTISANNNV